MKMINENTEKEEGRINTISSKWSPSLRSPLSGFFVRMVVHRCLPLELNTDQNLQKDPLGWNGCNVTAFPFEHWSRPLCEMYKCLLP